MLDDKRYRAELKHVRVIEKITEASNIVSLILKPFHKLKYEPMPPQFIMLWVPGVEEVPLSIADYDNGLIRVTIGDRGPTTHKLVHEINVGDILGFRGPFGKPMSLNKSKYLLIAGGLGAPPILFTLKTLLRKGVKDLVFVIGARTKNMLLYVNEVKNLGIDTYVATDDGSMGFKGQVTDLLDHIIKFYKGYEIIACGPPEMLKTLSLKLYKWGFLNSKIIAEAIVKCCIGVCGSCILGNGLLFCTDGPWFTVKDYVERILKYN